MGAGTSKGSRTGIGTGTGTGIQIRVYGYEYRYGYRVYSYRYGYNCGYSAGRAEEPRSWAGKGSCGAGAKLWGAGGASGDGELGMGIEMAGRELERSCGSWESGS